MKTLILLLLTTSISFGQNFMTRMNVTEVNSEGIKTQYDTIKVIWGVNAQKEVSFIWNDKMLTFTQKINHPTKNQKRAIKKIQDKLEVYKKDRGLGDGVKLQALYFNQWKEVFLVTIFIDRRMMIWVSRVDDKLPCYFFDMI